MDDEARIPAWKGKGAILLWVIIFVITLFGFSLLQTYFKNALGIPQGIWLGIIITEMSIALICLFFALVSRKSSLEELGIKRPPMKWLVLAVILAPVILVITGFVITIQTALTGEIPAEIQEEYIRLLMPTSATTLIVWILIYLLFVGPAEELFARGIVQKGLQNSFRAKSLPILLSGLLFGVWHIDPYRIAGVTAGGICFAYIYYKSGNNLIVVALLHGMYDAFSITIAFIAQQYLPTGGIPLI
ncbi:MAG: lysostaphin resistance A-like protein [Candidatus Heimdallarchaeota archaeon]